MNTVQLRRVRRMFSNDLVPMSINRRNQREWVRAVRLLGEHWVLSPSFKLKGLPHERTE